jgi:hypothetical protein
MVVGGGRVQEGAGSPVASVTTPPATAQSPPATPQPPGPVETTLPAPPPVPVSADGVVRRERQGFELTLPKGWKVDQSTTASYAQFGQPWLVISPGGRPASATENRRITIHTAVAPPSQYPGKPTKGGDVMGGQSFSTLAGAKSSGRRPDGRAFTMGYQGGLVGYHIAWPYRCEPADLCPEAGPWRVLQLEVEGTGRQNGTLFMGEAFSELDRQRPTAYIHCAPSRERVTATLLMGVAPEAVARVVVDVEGQPSAQTQTFRKKGFPFAFWVVAPLPPEARPRSFTGYDAAGQEVAKGTEFAGYADGCR